MGRDFMPNFKTFISYDEAAEMTARAKMLATLTSTKVAASETTASQLKRYGDGVTRATRTRVDTDETAAAAVNRGVLELAMPSRADAAQWEQLHGGSSFATRMGNDPHSSTTDVR